VQKFVEARDWIKYHTPKSLIQALQIEASELSELFLFKDFSLEEILADEDFISRINDEVADIFIYLLSFINALDLDLSKAFDKKMEKNMRKYPVKDFNNGIYYKK
jgi:NTP pyrophosphatase (non-canonical NTP hydrolase)